MIMIIIISTQTNPLHCYPLYLATSPNTHNHPCRPLPLPLCLSLYNPIIHILSLSLQSTKKFPSIKLCLESRSQLHIGPLSPSAMKHGQVTNKIIPSNHLYSMRSTSTTSLSTLSESETHNSGALLLRNSTTPPLAFRIGSISNLLRSFLNLVTIPASRWLTTHTQLSITPSLGRKVTGTLFGHRRGHVTFAVQDDPASDPVLLLELAMSTSALVKEMSSGLVRIALECEKHAPPARGVHRPGKLFGEARWTMYCNGKKCGHALSRACGLSDWHVLSTVRAVSVGAGVIPVVEEGGKASEGELLYMRARFERVVGSRDSEAFYMMNPDGNGGPELSIFLLRI